MPTTIFLKNLRNAAHVFSVNKALPNELLKAIGEHGKDFDTFGTYGHAMSGEAQKTADMVNETYSRILSEGVKDGVNHL
ncbi:MAG: hypothetical protein RR954_10140 [Christensenellaceae bacterium]